MKAGLRWILGLYIVALGSEELFIGPPPLVFVVGVVLFLLFSLVLATMQTRIRFPAVAVLMLLFAFWTFASIFWSVDPERSTRYALVLVQLLLTTWITAACIDDGASLERLVWCLALSSVWPSLMIIRGFLAGAPVAALGVPYHDIGERLALAGADPNLNAYRMGVSVLAAVHLGLGARALWARVLLGVLAGMAGFAVMLTGSRGGAMALAGALLALLVASARGRVGRVLLVLAALGCLAYVAIGRLPGSVSARYLGIGREVASGTMARRKYVYQEAGESFQRHPLLGVGYLAFETASRRQGGQGLAAHNDLLETLVDLGLVGLGLFLMLLAALGREVGAIPLPQRGFALALLVSYGLSAFTITLLGAKLPWICFGVLLGAARLPRNGPPGLPAPAP